MLCFALFVFFQHIVVEVDLGEKTTERFKSSKAEFTKYAMMNVSLRNIPYEEFFKKFFSLPLDLSLLI